MKTYLLAAVSISDPEAYKTYVRGFMKIFRNYEGKILSIEEAPVVKEGAWPYSRTVLLEFPSTEEMERWYHSEDYQALAQHRRNASVASIVALKHFEIK